MQTELERKYKISNIDFFRNKIIALGGKLKKKTTNIDVYFEIPQKIARTKYLRVRINQKEKRGILAYHEVVDDFTTKEWECNIDDAKIIMDILQKLGFKLDVIVDKKRETYQLKKADAVLDTVKKLGDFIEIEAENKIIFNKIVQELALKQEDIISGLGYPDLLKEKNATST